MKAKKVMVAMSGGVDSSVAALILKEQGHEVVGVTIKLWPKYIDPTAEGGCCSLAAVEDARRVAGSLDIPYYVLNMQEEFQRDVIDPFIQEYSRGRTPNPCIVCNRAVKFGRLLAKAREMGFDAVSTGHYARIVYNQETGLYRLLRGLDPHKDQSYALYGLDQHLLARVLFPLGEYRKEEIRAMAARHGLKIANKPDSQEICFVPDNNYKAFLEEHGGLKPVPGAIVDRRGNVFGQHQGVFNYTIGQRKGLGIATGEPMYVVEIDPEKNLVVVGSNQDVFSQEMLIEGFNWTMGSPPAREFGGEVQIRSHAQPAPGQIEIIGDRVKVTFASPQRAVTPGQSAVLYSGDEVLGGGIISRLGSA